MKNINKYLLDNLWDDFLKLQMKPHIFDDYCSYFNTLINWLKKHIDTIGDNLITKYTLDTILHINIENYISKNPDIILSHERIRMFSQTPETIDSFLMSLSDTLWDLIKLYSGKYCPACEEGELYYVIFELITAKQKVLALECGVCGWAENIDETEWSGGLVNIYPANETDLAAYGVNKNQS